MKRHLIPGKLQTQNKGGRPTREETQQKQIDAILDRHANGEALVDICEDLGLKPAVFRGWVRKDPELRREWELAKQEFAHSQFDSIASLAHQLATTQWTKEQNPQVQALRTAIEAKKTVAGKLNPREYGEQKDKQATTTINIITDLPLTEECGPATVIDGDFTVRVPLPAPKGK